MVLPVIDISSYLQPFEWPPSVSQAYCSKAIHDACTLHGFFYLTGHGLSQQEMDRVLQLAQTFFELPANLKDQYSITRKTSNSDGARGYQRLRENVTLGKPDYHEGFDFYRPVEPDHILPLHGVNQWPDDTAVPSFKETFDNWINSMLDIGRALVLATAVGLGMDRDELEAFMKLVDDSFWSMRCIGYPHLPEDHNGVSCGAHKDYGCYTLLHATSQRGALQVVSSKGEWVNADPMKAAFIVNIGEMWEVWTNGLYKSTLHRVIHKADTYRVSIPFFFEPNWDAEIRPLEAALRLQEASGVSSSPLKDSVVYGDFLTRKVAGNFSVGSERRAGRRY